MNPTDEVAAKPEVSERQSADAGAGSDDVLLRNFDERFRATLKDLQRTSDLRKPAEDLRISDGELNERLSDLPQPSPQRKFAEDVQNLLSQISHHLDYETSQRATINRRLLAIEDGVKKPGSRGFARYLIALCIGAAAVLAWQSYGAATKEAIATRAPDLGWSPETKQMIAGWVQRLGWAEPSGGQQGSAVRLSAAGALQSAPVEAAAPSSAVPSSATPSSAAPNSIAPNSIAPTAPTTAAVDLQKIQQIEADIAAARQTAEEQLTAVRQTVEHLAAGQDQMAIDITKLQAANQEILARIPAPPPPPRVAVPAHKPRPIVPPPARTPPPHP
jgi:hypothetical protein